MTIEFFYETRYVNKLDKKVSRRCTQGNCELVRCVAPPLQVVKIDCYDYDRVGSNDFIGTISIDLHTLATGPVFHDVLMRDGGKPAGRLQFCCEFEMFSEVELTMKSVEVSGLNATPGHSCDPYLQYYFSASEKEPEKKDKDQPFSQLAKGDGKKYKTPARLDTTSPSWEECEQMWFQATLREIVQVRSRQHTC
jgi:hypothetical protein